MRDLQAAAKLVREQAAAGFDFVKVYDALPPETQVFLNGGRWQGRQVVPEEWVELSLTRHVLDIGDWSDEDTRGPHGTGYALYREGPGLDG